MNINKKITTVKTIKVLIVDNIPIARKMIKEIMISAYPNINFKVSEIDTASLAKHVYNDALMREDPFNIAFIDIHLKKGSGFDILKYIRDIEATNNIKKDSTKYIRVILISANDQTEALKEIKQKYQVEYFINKPFNVDTMKEVLKEIGIEEI